MKSLRILTGHHAGAQLRLSARFLRIAADDEADIQITDWQHEAVALVTQENGSIMWHSLQGTAATGTAQPMPDFRPLRFAHVVLCAGPCDGAWPTDAELLATLAPAGRAAPRRGPRLRAAVGALAALVAAAGALSLAIVRPSAGAKPQAPLLQRVREALAASGAAGLTVRAAGLQITVEGLLDNSSDVARVRAALRPFADATVLHRYAAASDVVRAIADAAGDSGVQVAHRGGGVFVASGHTHDPDRLRDTLQRVAQDLQPQVQRIDVDLVKDVAPARTHPPAMLLGDGLQYVEGRNGTRHFSVVQPPPAAAPASAAEPAAPAAAPLQPERRP